MQGFIFFINLLKIGKAQAGSRVWDCGTKKLFLPFPAKKTQLKKIPINYTRYERCKDSFFL